MDLREGSLTRQGDLGQRRMWPTIESLSPTRAPNRQPQKETFMHPLFRIGGSGLLSLIMISTLGSAQQRESRPRIERARIEAVACSHAGKPFAVFLHTGDNKWLELQAKKRGEFRETERSSGAVVIKKENGVQLTLNVKDNTAKIKSKDGWDVLYTVTKTARSRLQPPLEAMPTPPIVMAAYAKPGEEEIIGVFTKFWNEKRWVEHNPDGAHTYFETGNDESSIHLTKVDGAKVAIDVRKGKVMLGAKPLYDLKQVYAPYLLPARSNGPGREDAPRSDRGRGNPGPRGGPIPQGSRAQRGGDDSAKKTASSPKPAVKPAYQAPVLPAGWSWQPNYRQDYVVPCFTFTGLGDARHPGVPETLGYIGRKKDGGRYHPAVISSKDIDNRWGLVFVDGKWESTNSGLEFLHIDYKKARYEWKEALLFRPPPEAVVLWQTNYHGLIADVFAIQAEERLFDAGGRFRGSVDLLGITWKRLNYFFHLCPSPETQSLHSCPFYEAKNMPFDKDPAGPSGRTVRFLAPRSK